MTIEVNDRIAPVSGKPLTIVALTDNPERVWVAHLEHGLVNGGGFLLDLKGYRVLKPQ